MRQCGACRGGGERNRATQIARKTLDFDYAVCHELAAVLAVAMQFEGDWAAFPLNSGRSIAKSLLPWPLRVMSPNRAPGTSICPAVHID